MTNFREEILKKIALTPKGELRERILKDENIRNCVLSSGANVTIYTGKKKQNAENVIDEISDIYIGLILRKNKKGNLDGLGALGGLAERTNENDFLGLSNDEKLKLLGLKDDVILCDNEVVLTNDIDIIRKNNVLREMSEELYDLGIEDIKIDREKLELIELFNVKDDNFITNIWDGKGECFAITPYCHIYKDDEGIIDKICSRAIAKNKGEVNEYKKIPLFEALSCFGNYVNKGDMLEDGRDAKNDYRYPHEYLAVWGLARRILRSDEKFMELALCVQENSKHQISFKNLAKHTKQSIDDIAKSLGIDTATLLCIENGLNKTFNNKNKQPLMCAIKNNFHKR